MPWNVPAQFSASVIRPALSPSTLRAMRSTRRAISLAARRENVISRIRRGSALLTMRWATRWARVLVFAGAGARDHQERRTEMAVRAHAMLEPPAAVPD